MDLIERQEAIEAIAGYLSYSTYTSSTSYLSTGALILSKVPSAEPRKGKWEKENIVLTSYPPQFQWHCSECGGTRHGFSAEVLTDFCPNCGADMRGTDD